MLFRSIRPNRTRINGQKSIATNTAITDTATANAGINLSIITLLPSCYRTAWLLTFSSDIATSRIYCLQHRCCLQLLQLLLTTTVFERLQLDWEGRKVTLISFRKTFFPPHIIKTRRGFSQHSDHQPPSLIGAQQVKILALK